ncbi:PREDICTED: F-box/LRR-repeat protein 6 [Pseudopodoces humilis]|uniref:F-box/LRR-repeat protein 6 n=1 Tax=Pseudopodoces humilis TaxID=181119 RepID=UPI0006B85357|nr:PREDICTED: F-box/LRR-repeat protein 6 [Pseudopodoces humilis]
MADSPPRKRRRAQVRRGEGPAPPPLPPEIVRRIFQKAVEGEGAVPFLCRVSRVCRLWRDLAADPRLWLRVHLRGHLGGHLRGHLRGHRGGPARSRRPPEQVLGPVLRLVETRFSLLQEFVLSDWSSHVGPVLQALSAFCPHLKHLELRHCQVEPAALGGFLAAPPPLQHLHLTCPRLRPVLPALAAGACPQLRVLELDQISGGPGPPLPLPLERLQAASLERLSVSPVCPCVTCVTCPGSGSGSWLAVTLRWHRTLLELDLSHWLERLSVSVPPGCPGPGPGSGSGSWLAVTLRWHRTLLELDLSGRRDPDLGGALAAFGPRDPLRVLRLAGTPVSPQELR